VTKSLEFVTLVNVVTMKTSGRSSIVVNTTNDEFTESFFKPRLMGHDFGKVGRAGAGPGQRTGLGGRDSPGRIGRVQASVLIMRDTMRRPADG
jgi:hypothetical protein